MRVPDDASTKRGLVIIPTFNEVESIRETIHQFFRAVGPTVDLLVVDDGSPDETARIVKEIAVSEQSGIFLIERSQKRGLGTAYVEGFRWGLARGYQMMVEMDADLSHDPAMVPQLLDALDLGNVLAIGSRYVPGGQVVNWSPFRRTLSRLGNLYARALLRYEVRDSTAGFRGYRSAWLKSQDLSTVSSQGYAFQIEMTRRVHRDGGSIAEIPITFVERTTGESKMSKRIVAEALLRVTSWGLKDRFSRS